MRAEVDSESGFFRNQHEAFRKGLNRNHLNQFESLNTDEERFAFVQNLQLNNGKINILNGGKSADSARDFKQQGNKAFQQGAYNVAAYFYTKSLLHCPTDHAEFAIVRANRSAASYHMQKYQQCMLDIKEALAEGYPKELLYKIKDRKARCLLALKQHKAALDAFRDTMAAIDDAKLKSEQRQKLQRDIQIMVTMMNKLPQKDEKITTKEESLKFRRNKVYKSASEAVEIKSDKDSGRYAVTGRSIDIGDLIMVESPHCAVLLQEFAATNCYECFKRVELGEPCPTCSQVVFCSKKCQIKSLETHHRIECPVLTTLWNSGISITCLMALRAISQRPAEFFNQEFKEFLGPWEKSEYSSLDYTSFYNLVRHETRRKSDDLLHRANVAVLLFNCLKAGGYFNQVQNQESKSALERKIGGLLLRHLQILQFNAHEVSELHIKGTGYTDCKSVFIGGAVYPTLALFNHSCNPAIVRYFNGTNVVARAIRDLKEGEELAENYGPIFTQMVKSERRTTLRNQYWFDCLCEACQNDWPLLDEMDVTLLPFRCDAKVYCPAIVKVPMTTVNCMTRCSNCGQTTNIIKGLKVLQDTENLFRLGVAYLDEGDADNALRKLTELYHLVNDVLAPPYKDIHLCQQAIRTCFLAMGNKCQIHPSKN